MSLQSRSPDDRLSDVDSTAERRTYDHNGTPEEDDRGKEDPWPNVSDQNRCRRLENSVRQEEDD